MIVMNNVPLWENKINKFTFGRNSYKIYRQLVQRRKPGWKLNKLQAERQV